MKRYRKMKATDGKLHLPAQHSRGELHGNMNFTSYARVWADEWCGESLSSHFSFEIDQEETSTARPDDEMGSQSGRMTSPCDCTC